MKAFGQWVGPQGSLWPPRWHLWCGTTAIWALTACSGGFGHGPCHDLRNALPPVRRAIALERVRDLSVHPRVWVPLDPDHPTGWDRWVDLDRDLYFVRGDGKMVCASVATGDEVLSECR